MLPFLCSDIPQRMIWVYPAGGFKDVPQKLTDSHKVLTLCVEYTANSATFFCGRGTGFVQEPLNHPLLIPPTLFPSAEALR